MVSKTTEPHLPWSKDLALGIVDKHRAEPGALMPILHEIQSVFGYVDEAAITLLAEELNVSRAEVHGVVTFYKDFRAEPAGASVVRVCRGEACQSMGAERLARHARQALGVDFGNTTLDGALTLEQVFCLGNCALSPAVMVDGELKGRVDEARFDRLITQSRDKIR